MVAWNLPTDGRCQAVWQVLCRLEHSAAKQSAASIKTRPYKYWRVQLLQRDVWVGRQLVKAEDAHMSDSHPCGSGVSELLLNILSPMRTCTPMPSMSSSRCQILSIVLLPAARQGRTCMKSIQSNNQIGAPVAIGVCSRQSCEKRHVTWLSRAHDALHLQANAQGAPAALQRSLLGGYLPAPGCHSTFLHAHKQRLRSRMSSTAMRTKDCRSGAGFASGYEVGSGQRA